MTSSGITPPKPWKLNDSIRVGVEAWHGTGSAAESKEWSASIFPRWVEIDGVRVPGNPFSIATEIDGEEFQTVTMTFLVSKFETVPSRDETDLVKARLGHSRGEGPKPEASVPPS